MSAWNALSDRILIITCPFEAPFCSYNVTVWSTLGMMTYQKITVYLTAVKIILQLSRSEVIYSYIGPLINISKYWNR